MSTTPTQSARVGLALVTAAALTWGTIGVAVSLIYAATPADPLSVGLLRLCFAVPALLLLGRIMVGPGLLRIRREHMGAMALIGGAFASYQVCYFAAIPRLGVAAAVMINICSAPVFTALLAGLFLRERLSAAVGGALVGAVAGTALLVGGAPQAASAGDLAIGAGLALAAGFSYSLVVLGSRSVASSYHPLQPIAVAFTLSALLLLPFALASGLTLSFTPQGWALLAYLGVVPTALAYGLYVRGLRSVSATTAAILSLLEPLGSTILAVIFLDERLTGLGLLGGGLLLASMALLYVQQTRAQAGPAPQAG